MKKLFVQLLLSVRYLSAFAQGDNGTNDFFTGNLKVYVVIGVGIVILSCLFAFLFSLERRLSKLEQTRS